MAVSPSSADISGDNVSVDQVSAASSSISRSKSLSNLTVTLEPASDTSTYVVKAAVKDVSDTYVKFTQNLSHFSKQDRTEQEQELMQEQVPELGMEQEQQLTSEPELGQEQEPDLEPERELELEQDLEPEFKSELGPELDKLSKSVSFTIDKTVSSGENQTDNPDSVPEELEPEVETPRLKDALLGISNQYLNVIAFLLDQRTRPDSSDSSRPATVVENKDLEEVVEDPCVEEKASICGKDERFTLLHCTIILSIRNRCYY